MAESKSAALPLGYTPKASGGDDGLYGGFGWRSRPKHKLSRHRFMHCARAASSLGGKRQLACKPGSVSAEEASAAMAIHLGRASPRASSNQPGRRCGNAFRRAVETARLCRPYSVLLPAGFAMPALLPALRCALTAPFHPYPFCASRYVAETANAIAQSGRYPFCGTFPRVAPAGRYPAPCFRGARTFLHPNALRPFGPQRASGQRPSSQLAL